MPVARPEGPPPETLAANYDALLPSLRIIASGLRANAHLRPGELAAGWPTSPRPPRLAGRVALARGGAAPRRRAAARPRAVIPLHADLLDLLQRWLEIYRAVLATR